MHGGRQPLRFGLALSALLLLMVACAQPAPSPPPGAVRLSGPDLVAASCRGEAASSVVEPHLGVDPTNARHLLAAWQQDRDARGGALAIALAESRDGGRSWSRSLLPGASRCSGGASAVVSDPWVSFGPDGAVYVSSLAVDFGAAWRVQVSVRPRGGREFELPVVVRSLTNPELVDKPVVLADPNQVGTIYAAWVEGRSAQDAGQFVGFAASRDGGRSWGAAARIWGDGRSAEQGSQLLVARGVLYDLVVEAPPTVADGSQGRVVAVRSADGGASWAEAGAAPAFGLARIFDSAASRPVRAPSVVEGAAAAGSGELYAAWFTGAGSPSTTSVEVSSSLDGGVAWSAPVAASDSSGRAFLPSLAVSGDGRVACLYYELRAGDATAEVWLAVSGDGGRTWSRRRLGAAFDFGLAPVTEDVLFLGDYFGLVGLPGGFAAAWVEARAGGTSVWFALAPTGGS